MTRISKKVAAWVDSQKEIAEEIGALTSRLYAIALMCGINIKYLINLIFRIANVIAYIHDANI